MNALGQSTCEYIATPSSATRRSLNEKEGTKMKAKKLRNLGQAYISRNNHKGMPARQVGELC